MGTVDVWETQTNGAHHLFYVPHTFMLPKGSFDVFSPVLIPGPSPERMSSVYINLLKRGDILLNTHFLLELSNEYDTSPQNHLGINDWV